MSAGQKPPGKPEIPDLSPRRSSASNAAVRPEAAAPAPRVSAKPAPSGNPQDYFGSGTFGDDDDDTFGAGPGLALETDDASTSHGSPDAAFGSGAFGGGTDDLDTFEASKASVQSGTTHTAAARNERRKWPTGISPDTASLRIDSVEVTLAAGYGTAPESFLMTPAYAVRVFRRKRALAAKVAELAASFAEAEKARDTLVVAVAQQQRGKILMADEGDKLFEPVVALERVALERRSALAGTSAEFDRRTGELDGQLAALRTEAAAKHAATEQRIAARAEQQRLLDRAEAKKKRLYIEIRAIVDVVEKAGGQMSPAQSAKVQELEEEVASHKPELDAATAATQAATAAVTAAESDEQQLARRMREAERARRALDEESQKELGTRSQGVSEVEEQRNAALAEIGRAVLAAKGRLVDLAPETLDGITRAEEVVERRATELEKLVRALDAYDAGAFKNGIMAAGGVLLLVVVMIAVLATR